MKELQEISKKTFGRDLNTDEQKYYYYDSDDDRIDISDDEDLESAVEQCKKSCLKIFIENYDAKKDPFFTVCPGKRSEKDTRPSTDRSKVNSRFSNLVSSGKSSAGGSIGSSVDPISESKYEDVKIQFLNIHETVSDEESEGELEEKKEEVKKLPGENSEIQKSNFSGFSDKSRQRERKNTEVDSCSLQKLEEPKLQQSKSLTRK